MNVTRSITFDLIILQGSPMQNREHFIEKLLRVGRKCTLKFDHKSLIILGLKKCQGNSPTYDTNLCRTDAII